MITVITGTPGAGKTLYAVDKLLIPLGGQTLTYDDDDGNPVTVPRTIYTNINGLLLDHELIDMGDKEGVMDWHKWAKPGSVIVIDEFQKVWPPRPNGSKIPDAVQALDTHRHMGVDFILITQNVMNVDRHIHALGGRHLHVRRIANMRLAVVYEWDHVSRALMYSKALTKAPWKYSKRAMLSYRSAKAHTKTPRKMPGLVWFILIGLAVGAYLGPTTYKRLTERTQGKPLAAQMRPASSTATTVPNPLAPAPAAPVPASMPAPAPVGPPVEGAKAVFAGCMAAKGVCRCYDSSGTSTDVDDKMCHELTDRSRPVFQLAGSQLDAMQHSRPTSGNPRQDLEMYAWMARQGKASK